MSHHVHKAPIPPEQRSPKGPTESRLDTHGGDADSVKANPDKIGRTGNIKENTTHQGYQQDR